MSDEWTLDDLTEELPQATLQELVDAVSYLQDRVDELSDRAWRIWPDPPADLIDWVEGYLIPTFSLSGTLADWQQNKATKSELSALFGGYLEAVKPKASPWDMLTWHGHLAATITRIQEHDRRAGASSSLIGW